MKILLINMPFEGQSSDTSLRPYFPEEFYVFPPLGLISVATGIDKRHNVKILDVMAKKMTIAETIDYILDYKPDILGVSAITRQLYPLYEICRKVKGANPKIKIFAGGPHINDYPMETMEWGTIDYALGGFAEYTFPQLVEAIDGGEKPESLQKIPTLYYKSDGKIISNPGHKKPLVLDEFPKPNRKLVDLSKYFSVLDKKKMTTMNSSRGCPFKCIYCNVQEKKFHYKSAKYLVDEMEEILSLGVEEVFIHDDAFNVLRQRVVDICNEILKRKLKIKWCARSRVTPFDDEMAKLMKKAGCVRLHVGVESLDQKILDYINKGITVEQINNFFRLCKKYKIGVMGYFMVGFPMETKEYRASILKDIERLDPEYFTLNILFPYPKTAYYNELIKNGTYKKDYWAEYSKKPTKDFEMPLPRSAELEKELEELTDTSYRKYFFRPRRILREINHSISSPGMLFRKTKLAAILLLQTLKKSEADIK